MLSHSVRIANLVRSAVKPDEGKIDSKYDNLKTRSKPEPVDPEVILKKEVREAVGKIDPQIKKGVEDSLRTISYKRKTKIDAMGDVAESLEKKIAALQKERFSLEQYPCKVVEKNPILDLNPDAISEDHLLEKEVLRAYRQKDVEKVELLLLKSKTRLEEMGEKHKEVKPYLYPDNTPTLSSSTLNSSTLGKSTLSVTVNNSQLSSAYEKAKKKPSLTNSNFNSPYLTASTAISGNFTTPSKSITFSPSKAF